MTTATIKLQSYPRDWKRLRETYDVSLLRLLDMDDVDEMTQNPRKWIDDIVGDKECDSDHIDKSAAFILLSRMSGKMIASIVRALAKTALRRCDLYIANGDVDNAESRKWIPILHEMAQALFSDGRHSLVVGMFDGDSIHCQLKPADVIQESGDRLRTDEVNEEKYAERMDKRIEKIRKRTHATAFDMQREEEGMRVRQDSEYLYNRLMPVITKRILSLMLPEWFGKSGTPRLPTWNFFNVKTKLHKHVRQLVGDGICVAEIVVRDAICQLLKDLELDHHHILSSLRFRCHDVPTDVSFLMRDYDGNVHNVTGFAFESEAVLDCQ